MATNSFAGKQTDTTCPNCGRQMFSGLAEGNVLVCRDADGNGCQMAYDPSVGYGATEAPAAVKIEDVEASPQVGPADENPDTVTDPGAEVMATLQEPWEPPVSAPQAVNAEPTEEPVPAPAPAPAPAPPVPPASDTGGTTDSGTTPK